jgi:hypothetical protein
MVEVLIQLAKSGDVQALKLVIQHLLPTVQQKTDVTITTPISITWGAPESRPEKTGKQVG